MDNINQDLSFAEHLFHWKDKSIFEIQISLFKLPIIGNEKYEEMIILMMNKPAE